MKKIITKSILCCLAIGLLIYVGRLCMHPSLLVTKNPVRNIGGLLLAGLVGCYMLVLVAQPYFAPKNKWTLSLLGVGLLVISHILYQDIPSMYIYLADSMKLFALLFVVGGGMGLFHDEQVLEQRKMEEAEIIEV